MKHFDCSFTAKGLTDELAWCPICQQMEKVDVIIIGKGVVHAGNKEEAVNKLIKQVSKQNPECHDWVLVNISFKED